MEITPKTVADVARLARLAISDQEASRHAGQLGSILQYVAQISQADVSGVEAMAHATPLHTVLREDVSGEGLPIEKVLQNAPQTDGRFFKVPKVIGSGEEA